MSKKLVAGTTGSVAGRYELLLDVTRTLLEHGRDDKALVEFLFSKVASHIDADVCFNYALDEGGTVLNLVAGPGIPAEFREASQKLQLGQAFCGLVAASCAPLAADALRIAGDRQGAFIHRMGVRAYACHPLMGKDGALLGTLSFASTRRDSFNPDEVDFLQTLCHFVALAWQRSRAEAALAQANQHLEERVREEVAARQEAQARAAHAERMQALGQLAGGIAHDFNNVLQAIESGAGLIDNRAEDPQAVRRYARIVLRAASRGAGVARRLLTFARRGDLRTERIDVAALLHETRDVLADTLGPLVAVSLRVAPGLPALMADKGQLETVLVNLGTNARDAMPGGGSLAVTATLEHVSGLAHPADLPAGRYVVISVADTGSGMDRATLSRAAEPFFTTKSVGQGTGLGLSMAKGFAEQSGGGLTIDSVPGQGTTVTIWLPAAPDAESPAHAPPVHVGSADGRCRILLVEDDDMVRATLCESLETCGFLVRAVGNGAVAMAELEAAPSVGVLVSDLAMPGVDGLALIRAAQQRWPSLPAILLTGDAIEEAELHVGAPPPGLFSVLRKPVGVADLCDAIKALKAG